MSNTMLAAMSQATLPLDGSSQGMPLRRWRVWRRRSPALVEGARRSYSLRSLALALADAFDGAALVEADGPAVLGGTLRPGDLLIVASRHGPETRGQGGGPAGRPPPAGAGLGPDVIAVVRSVP